MSVGIVGLGVVGGALYRAIKTAGHEVHGYDVDPARSKESLQDVFASDVVQIAVPTPADESGECDLSAVNAVFEQASSCRTNALVVLRRSTVPVGTTDGLIARYPKLRIGFSPEFVRQATADRDLASEAFRIYGGRADDSGKYFKVMRTVSEAVRPSEIVMSSAEAEMTKLFLNAFAAMKTVFATEMSIAAQESGVDWLKVVAAAQLEGRVGTGYLSGIGPDGNGGFGGKCLPKDTRMLAKLLGPECLLVVSLG